MSFLPIALPDPGTLVPRGFVARLDPSVSVCWIEAGPGWGKTCAASLIAARARKPVLALAGVPDPGALARWLDLPDAATGDSLAAALARRLRDQFPQGAVLVLDQVDRAARGSAADFVGAVVAWASPPYQIVVATRIPLGVPLARRCAQGEALRLGPRELAWVPDEIALLVGHTAPPALITVTCGWPLAIAALAKATVLAESELRAMLEDLAREELLDRLPAELDDALRLLAPLPRFVPDAAVRLLPRYARDRIARLQTWGLLLEADGACHWHPLVTPWIERSWTEAGTPVERQERLIAMGRELARVEPEAAIALLARAGAFDEVGPIVEGSWRAALAARDYGRLRRFVDGVAPLSADGPAVLLLVDGLVRASTGSHSAARERFEQAAAGFERAGCPAERFEAVVFVADVCQKTGDRAGFDDALSTLAVLEPEARAAPRIHLKLLDALDRWASGDGEAAIVAFRRALDIPFFDDPLGQALYLSCSIDFGSLLAEREEYLEAVYHFERGLALCRSRGQADGTERVVLLSMALIACETGELDRAEVLLQEASRLPPPASWDQQLRSSAHESFVLLALRKDAEAESRLRGVLGALLGAGSGHDPQIAAIEDGLAVVCRRRGEFGSALKHHERGQSCSQFLPNKARLLANWASTLLLAGRASEGLERIDEGLALVTEASPFSRSWLELVRVVALRRLGRDDLASRSLEAALGFICQRGCYGVVFFEPDLSEDLWPLISALRPDVLDCIEARFPRQTREVRPPVELRAPGSRTLGHGAPCAVSIRCLGDLDVAVGGRLVTRWPRRTSQALLAHLLMAPRGASQEELCDALWPDLPPPEALHQLGNATSVLRRLFEPDLRPRERSHFLRLEAGIYRLERTLLTIDVEDFCTLREHGRSARRTNDPEAARVAFGEAIALYRGDLFAGPIFANWFEPERERLRLDALEILEFLTNQAFEAAHFEAARGLAEQILTLDPIHEGAHRHLMNLYARFGERRLIARQILRCEEALAELGLAPSERLRAEFTLP